MSKFGLISKQTHTVAECDIIAEFYAQRSHDGSCPTLALKIYVPTLFPAVSNSVLFGYNIKDSISSARLNGCVSIVFTHEIRCNLLSEALKDALSAVNHAIKALERSSGTHELSEEEEAWFDVE